MANFSERQIEHCWNKAPKRRDKDLSGKKYRTGSAGALIKKEEYGLQTEFGWNIDHQTPESAGGTDEDPNIRAMHWENNIAKGDDYEEDSNGNYYYRAMVYSEQKETNVENNTGMSFTDNEAKDE